jgi:hypothetical protein
MRKKKQKKRGGRGDIPYPPSAIALPITASIILIIAPPIIVVLAVTMLLVPLLVLWLWSQLWLLIAVFGLFGLCSLC